MPYLRLDLQLAIPLEGDVPVGATPSDILNQLPVEVANNLPTFIKEIRRAKKYAVKINEGLANEEMTVIATYHICYHDETGSSISCSDSLVDI